MVSKSKSKGQAGDDRKMTVYASLSYITKKVFKGVGYFLSAVTLIILIVAAYLYVGNKSSLVLPKPSGPYFVARAMFDWTDTSRVDSLSPAVSKKRELLVWVWYPAKNNNPAERADYMPEFLRKAEWKYEGLFFSTFLSHDESKVQCSSTQGGVFSDRKNNYPVVIMRSGVGALAIDYTTIAEDLASHGYIVVSADAPYTTTVVAFPDGRVINKTPQGSPGEQASSAQQEIIVNKIINLWSSDTRFMLDKLTYLNEKDTSGIFKGKLNMAEVGIFGHSFGGATAAEVCHDDTRFKAGIDMDGQPFGKVISEGTHQPFMIMLGDHAKEPGVKQILRKIESVYDHLPTGNRLMISIPSARHFNFSDQALLKNIYMGRFVGALGSIAPERGLTVASSCIRNFFDVYLKKKSDIAMKKSLNALPEVHVVSE